MRGHFTQDGNDNQGDTERWGHERPGLGSEAGLRAGAGRLLQHEYPHTDVRDVWEAEKGAGTSSHLGQVSRGMPTPRSCGTGGVAAFVLWGTSRA